MRFDQAFLSLATTLSLAEAMTVPTYSGYQKVWTAGFAGKEGHLPSSKSWNFISPGTNDNHEASIYTTSPNNLKLSGEGSLLIIPKKDSSYPGGWTSGRIESTHTVLPTAGKITRVEASIRLGGTAAVHKQGIWPAFWMLGEAYREGVAWPGCGEIDIMENINGQTVSYGTVHCDVYPGGVCNESNGLGSGTTLDDHDYHVWRVEFNRVKSDWKKQSITWYKDGAEFFQLTGATINDATVWATLCQSPFYMILNVAVGGDWPGYPNSATYGGTGVRMEVGYVAHYVST